MKHLKCYGKHMVVKHLAMVQYFSGGGIARSGRPSTAVTDVSIAKAVELLEND